MENEEITAKTVFRKLHDTKHLMKMLHRKRCAEKGPMADTERGRGRIMALQYICVACSFVHPLANCTPCTLAIRKSQFLDV